MINHSNNNSATQLTINYSKSLLIDLSKMSFIDIERPIFKQRMVESILTPVLMAPQDTSNDVLV